jgi:hypothetical protein
MTYRSSRAPICGDAPVTQHALNAIFEVKGRFSTSPRGFQCRSELQIRRRANEASTLAPDAIIVMMNPGGSVPLEPCQTNELVRTRPDTTQFQIMRVMSEVDWSFVRILNLSDLRDANSARLMTKVEQYQRAEGHDRHSIFSLERRADLLSMTADLRATAKVIAAWGVHRRLRPLAQQALGALAGKNVTGLQKTEDWSYYHPLPRNGHDQRAWVRSMVDLLKLH